MTVSVSVCLSPSSPHSGIESRPRSLAPCGGPVVAGMASLLAPELLLFRVDGLGFVFRNVR